MQISACCSILVAADGWRRAPGHVLWWYGVRLAQVVEREDVRESNEIEGQCWSLRGCYWEGDPIAIPREWVGMDCCRGGEVIERWYDPL